MNATDTKAMLKSLGRLDDLVRGAETLADELRMQVRQIGKGDTGLESRLVQIEAMLRDTKRATGSIYRYVHEGRRLKRATELSGKLARKGGSA